MINCGNLSLAVYAYLSKRFAASCFMLACHISLSERRYTFILQTCHVSSRNAKAQSKRHRRYNRVVSRTHTRIARSSVYLAFEKDLGVIPGISGY